MKYTFQDILRIRRGSNSFVQFTQKQIADSNKGVWPELLKWISRDSEV